MFFFLFCFFSLCFLTRWCWVDEGEFWFLGEFNAFFVFCINEDEQTFSHLQVHVYDRSGWVTRCCICNKEWGDRKMHLWLTCYFGVLISQGTLYFNVIWRLSAPIDPSVTRDQQFKSSDRAHRVPPRAAFKRLAKEKTNPKSVCVSTRRRRGSNFRRRSSSRRRFFFSSDR